MVENNIFNPYYQCLLIGYGEKISALKAFSQLYLS